MVYFILQYLMKGYPGRNLKQRPRENAVRLLTSSYFILQPSPTSLGNGTARSGLGSLTLISNFLNAPKSSSQANLK